MRPIATALLFWLAAMCASLPAQEAEAAHGHPAAGGGGEAPGSCKRSNPGGCVSSGDYKALPGFKRDVRRFVGDKRTPAFGAREKVADKILSTLDRTDEVQRVGAYYQLSGCIEGACATEAAIVVDPQGRILGAAMIQYYCTVPKGLTHCASRNQPDDCKAKACVFLWDLSIFARADTSRTPVVDDFKRWAQDHFGGPDEFDHLAFTHVVTVAAR